MDDFRVNKTKKGLTPGFIPKIINSVGYGSTTAIDPVTKKMGVVPLQTEVSRGEPGQERIVDNPECYTKAILFEGEDDYVYYIRTNNRGDLSDPWGVDADSAQNAKLARHSGRPEWEYRRVAQEIFIEYLRYLTTQNKNRIRKCERDVKDA